MSAHTVRAVASSKPHNANSVESLGRLAGTPLKELPASHFKGGAMTLSDRAPASLEGDLVNLPRSSGKLTSTNFDGGSMALTASQTGGEVTKRPASPLPTVYSRMPEGVATDRRAATAPSERARHLTAPRSRRCAPRSADHFDGTSMLLAGDAGVAAPLGPDAIAL